MVIGISRESPPTRVVGRVNYEYVFLLEVMYFLAKPYFPLLEYKLIFTMNCDTWSFKSKFNEIRPFLSSFPDSNKRVWVKSILGENLL
jgi:hypothetical protein